MTDFISRQIKIVEENLNKARPLKKAVSQLEELLHIQKELQKDYHEAFLSLGLGNLVINALEKPQQFTSWAIAEFKDIDGMLDESAHAIDKALAEIIHELGFDAFLDSRVMNAIQEAIEANFNLPHTHHLMNNRRIVEGNNSTITVDFNQGLVDLKFPYNPDDLNDFLIAQLTVAVLPFMHWNEKSRNKYKVTVNGYNGCYIANIGNCEISGFRLRLDRFDSDHLDLFSELRSWRHDGKRFLEFSELVRYLVEINDALRIRNRN